MHDIARWNLSPERLYQECFTRYFIRERVDPAPCGVACNVGIGLGEFDDFMGYWLLGHGSVVSIDIDDQQVRRLAERQRAEEHPNPSRVVHADLLQSDQGPFDLVTVTGTTLHETHAPARALRCALDWVKPGGRLVATIIHDMGHPDRLIAEVEGVEAKETFTGMPGAEFTALLARRKV